MWGFSKLGKNKAKLGYKTKDVGVKTGGSRVGGPELWILDQWGTRDEGHDVYPGLGPLEEVKSYVLLDYIEVYRTITESIYHEIV